MLTAIVACAVDSITIPPELEPALAERGSFAQLVVAFDVVLWQFPVIPLVQ